MFYSEQKHLFHLVDASPWPILTAHSVMSMLLGVVLYMHRYEQGLLVLFIGLISTLICMVLWWRDVIREATYEGCHTLVVQIGLRYGMLLFIVSEVMFFFAFFWAFFYSSFSPTIQIGCIWPPVGVTPFNPFEIPLLNTLILLTSGATITWAHYALVGGDKIKTLLALYVTVGLAIWFSLLQLFEYSVASFSISDGIFGSTFFLATGFHGFHVIIGTIFIAVCSERVYVNQFTRQHHFGFEASAWYWHFVDVVWIFLYLTVYGWSYL